MAAITTPGALGARVKETLRSRHIPPGPVVLHTRSGRWTFLLKPDLPFDDVDLHAEMYRASVTVAPLGASVALPVPSDAQDGYRSWCELPVDGFRPSAALLLEIIRECTKATSGGCRDRRMPADTADTTRPPGTDNEW
ncbi:hypothetical protein C5E45_31490 [Nocardia nova]|uniref:Uncharacterized protein n=1 Tax=Nocardia nova TaxID=37330 RepID=A0A2S6AGC0_9NOCA|nr:hypothetical protein [Nocardia nova]PPJ19993.1 hypothetical protein C5E41_29825 [Nocardia nova]PPJ33823.1 hypothetical protein C5E45_31490 [Nocardia nova]